MRDARNKDTNAPNPPTLPDLVDQAIDLAEASSETSTKALEAAHEAPANPPLSPPVVPARPGGSEGSERRRGQVETWVDALGAALVAMAVALGVYRREATTLVEIRIVDEEPTIVPIKNTRLYELLDSALPEEVRTALKFPEPWSWLVKHVADRYWPGIPRLRAIAIAKPGQYTGYNAKDETYYTKDTATEDVEEAIVRLYAALHAIGPFSASSMHEADISKANDPKAEVYTALQELPVSAYSDGPSDKLLGEVLGDFRKSKRLGLACRLGKRGVLGGLLKRRPEVGDYRLRSLGRDGSLPGNPETWRVEAIDGSPPPEPPKPELPEPELEIEIEVDVESEPAAPAPAEPLAVTTIAAHRLKAAIEHVAPYTRGSSDPRCALVSFQEGAVRATNLRAVAWVRLPGTEACSFRVSALGVKLDSITRFLAEYGDRDVEIQEVPPHGDVWHGGAHLVARDAQQGLVGIRYPAERPLAWSTAKLEPPTATFVIRLAALKVAPRSMKAEVVSLDSSGEVLSEGSAPAISVCRKDLARVLRHATAPVKASIIGPGSGLLVSEVREGDEFNTLLVGRRGT